MTAWDDLVRSALLGVEREPVAPDGLPEPVRSRLGPTDDPARLLLDAAALLAGRRRAGLRPVTVPSADPDVAPPDPRPLVPPAAARRLARLLAGERAGLLSEWLALVAERGMRVPPEHLPALAVAAVARSALRPVVAAAAGPRGPWLAARTPEWPFLADSPDPTTTHLTAAPNLTAAPDSGAAPNRAAVPDAAAVPDRVAVPGAAVAAGRADPDVWRYGGTVARWAWLERTRRVDPDLARTTLLSTWSTEPADIRATFVEALSVGLGPADEDFLESTLDDRAQDVRRLAAGLLARLPGSRLGARMAARLAELVSRNGSELSMALPVECDAAMRRDGVRPVPPAGSGSRAWWFRQVVAAAPLSWWTTVAPRPLDVLRLPVAGPGGATALHAALARAAADQRDPTWAAALLAVTDLATEDAADLVGVLPPERWADAVAELAEHGLPTLVGLFLALPGPWPADLGDLLLDRLAAQAGERTLAPIADAAARMVPPVCLHHPITGRVAEPGACPWHHRLVETLLFRRAMYEELS